MTAAGGRRGAPALAVALALVEVVGLVAVYGAGLAAWGVGVVTRGYDYDEVLRAHSVWLVSRGLRPYSDFFEVHPPYFVLLTPVVRAFADPADALRALRVTAAAGNLAFLGGLVALAAGVLPAGVSRRRAWLAVGVVAFHPRVLDDLVEFRVDGWGYAVIAWAVVGFCRRPGGAYRGFWFGAATGVASWLLSPKMVLLPPLVVAADLYLRYESRRGLVRGALGYLAGVGAAGVGFLLFLAANGIGAGRTVLLLGRYHALSNARAGFRYGLLGQVVAARVLLGLVVAGFLVWAWGRARARRGTAAGPYEPALAAWLVAQGALVSYPYKQYYAPWFLFASVFVAALGGMFAGRWKGAVGALFLLAAAWVGLGAWQVGWFWAATDEAAAEHALIRWMNRVATPGDRVVGSPPYHPIDRLDTFFLSFNTSDPTGFDSERIFGELPGLRPFVTEARYRAELEAHPPAFVVLRSPAFAVTHPALQKAVLDDELLRRGYRTVRVGAMWFAVRPDRYEWARRNGELE